MANDATKVSTGKPSVSGAVFRAASGTALPTDAKSDLAAAYKDLGYCSEDGITEKTTRDMTDFKAWGGDTVDSSQTAYGKSFEFTLIESSRVDAMKVIAGDSNVTDAGGKITMKHNAAELTSGIWVFDMIKKGGKLYRAVVPVGKVTEVGDIVYKDDEVISYPVVISAYPDSNGDYVLEYEQGSDYISISVQPQDKAVTAGNISGTVTVTATGSDTLSYKWYEVTSGAVDGATTNALTIPTTLTAGTYYYYCVVSMTGVEPVTSEVATVTVAAG